MAYYFETSQLSICGFMEKIKQPNFKDLVIKEFRQLKTVPIGGTIYNFLRAENAKKNRYPNILCWDHSRVVLSSHGTQVHEQAYNINDLSTVIVTLIDNSADYIHANFVDGFKDKKKFICCQAPKANTAADLYRCKWEQNSSIIVSLTGVSDKDETFYEYWVRAKGHKIVFARYIVETVDAEAEAAFLTTKLSISDVTTGESRLITHYWYLNWPDNGAPENPKEVVELLSAVNIHREKLMEMAKIYNMPKPGPILVYCLAGVGRTGTFCAADHALGRLKKENKISVQDSVISVRRMRHSSVMTPGQYMFIYNIIKHVRRVEEYNRAFDQQVPNIL